QLGTLSLLMAAAIPTLDVPKLLSGTVALESGWTGVPVAGLFGGLVLWLVFRLSARFPGETIIQYAPKVLGTPLGQIVNYAYIFSVFMGLAVIIREFSDFVLVTSLPKTPISVVLGFITIVAIVSVRNGVEVLARLSFLLTPIAITVVFGILAFGTTKMQLDNILPVWPHGFMPSVRASIESFGFFGIFYNLVVLLPFATDKKKARRAALVWYLVLVFILTAATIGVNATFSELSQRYTYPLFSFARVASTGPVAFRMDVFIVALEVLGLSTQVSIWLFICNYSLAQGLGLRDERSLIFPVALAAVAVSILEFASRTELITWLTYVLPVNAVVFQLGIPALLLCVAAVRGLHEGGAPHARSQN
ncbi:MAG TPA: endospore germination permease, partial [Limnochordia bacterium]|nr:endospore germination permease [Limnochordia bacterium]